MRILTLCSEGWEEMHALTAPSKKEYADRWCCELADIRVSNEEASCCWTRPLRWKEELNKVLPGDYLWFLGADTMITNQTVDWKEMVRGGGDLKIGMDLLGINSDSIFFRNCPAMHALLEDVLALKREAANEQEALMHAMSRTESGMPVYEVRIAPQSFFNAYPYGEIYNYPSDRGGQWKIGSFVLHVPGEPYERRLDFIRKAEKDIVR
jgi:hypothetical protein